MPLVLAASLPQFPAELVHPPHLSVRDPDESIVPMLGVDAVVAKLSDDVTFEYGLFRAGVGAEPDVALMDVNWAFFETYARDQIAVSPDGLWVVGLGLIDGQSGTDIVAAPAAGSSSAIDLAPDLNLDFIEHSGKSFRISPDGQTVVFNGRGTEPTGPPRGPGQRPRARRGPRSARRPRGLPGGRAPRRPDRVRSSGAVAFAPATGTVLGKLPRLANLDAAAGTPIAVPIRNDCAPLGESFCTQLASFGASRTIAATNAIDITLGGR